MSDEPATLTLFDICNRRHYGDEKYVDAAAYAALKARLREVERERDALLDGWDAAMAVVKELRSKNDAMSADSAEGK